MDDDKEAIDSFKLLLKSQTFIDEITFYKMKLPKETMNILVSNLNEVCPKLKRVSFKDC
jgi:hypothetical protein